MSTPRAAARTTIAAAIALACSAWLHAAGPAPVADAAMAKDAAAVRALLKDGADVNAAQGDGMTALHWAAMHGDADMTAMLLYAGANTGATTRLGGYTPLHLASEAGATAVASALLDAGADANTATATGVTPLMLAASSGQADAVRRLLVAGADPNAKDKAQEQTPLMFAAALGRTAAVGVLLDGGADLAATAKVIDLASLTAPGDDDPTQSGRSQPSNAQPTPRPGQVPGVTRAYLYNELIGAQGGLNALHFAARQGHRDTVRLLLDKGADVNAASPADRMTPLLIATINGHFDLAMELLERGADPNMAADNGVTPLYGVVNVQWAPKSFYPQPRAYLQQETPYLKLMTALLEKGANPNARTTRKVWYMQYNFDLLRIDESGATPFWRAAYASDVDAMKLLVEHGADPHLPTVKPAAPTRRGAAERGPVEDQSGLAPLPVGGPGIPPLQAAAGSGFGEGFAGNAHRTAPGGMLPAVKYLVEELGADVNQVDHDGSTAVHHAAARGDNEMILYLVSKGADVTRINRDGQTTADMANGPVQRIQPFPETLALLMKLGAKNSNKCVSC